MLVEAWWLNGRVPDCCPAVPGLTLASPQPTADCQSPGGLPPGMALGCRLNSVRGNRVENYENGPLVCQIKYKEKKLNVGSNLGDKMYVGRVLFG